MGNQKNCLQRRKRYMQTSLTNPCLQIQMKIGPKLTDGYVNIYIFGMIHIFWDEKTHPYRPHTPVQPIQGSTPSPGASEIKHVPRSGHGLLLRTLKYGYQKMKLTPLYQRIFNYFIHFGNFTPKRGYIPGDHRNILSNSVLFLTLPHTHTPTHTHTEMSFL